MHIVEKHMIKDNKNRSLCGRYPLICQIVCKSFGYIRHVGAFLIGFGYHGYLKTLLDHNNI